MHSVFTVTLYDVQHHCPYFAEKLTERLKYFSKAEIANGDTGSRHSAHGESDMPAASIQVARVQLFPKYSGMFIKRSRDSGL